MKVETGIILTGGTGSRLAPLNSLFNKHIVPVYNKFIVDYSVDTLKNIGVKNLTVVLGGTHFSQVVSHLQDGEHLGMKINYVYQSKPMGIAQAINMCGPSVFSWHGKFAVILGDNIFENPVKFIESDKSAQIVLHRHPELNRFGVASYDNGELIKIVEKPEVIDQKLDNYAITGCYLFDRQFFKFFEHLQPSARGEYEITDIIRMYADIKELDCTFVDGMWSDAGTHQSINFVNNFFYNKYNGNI
jgi:glucose-1-phosphate thymidylyltransferase